MNNEKSGIKQNVFKQLFKKATPFLRKVLRFLREYFIGGHSNKPVSKKKKKLFALFTLSLFMAAIIVFLAVFTLKVCETDSRDSDFSKNAAAVCSDLISETGTSRIECLDIPNLENTWRMLGITTVRCVDFDADGNNELVIAYFKGGKYYVEVWGSKGKEFVSLYKDEANSIEAHPELGSWLTVYHSGSKYYIGKLMEDGEESNDNNANEENMDLLALHGSKFKEDEMCCFEPETSYYLFDGEIDSTHFETIQFSALTSARAEYQLNTVYDSLIQFISEKEANDNLPKTDEQKKASAFSKVIDSKIKKFGEPHVSTAGSSAFANGVAVAALVDFNGDGSSELFLMSRNIKDYNDTDAYPKYLTEVFAWESGIAKKIYEGETTSTYFDNEKTDIFYILQKKNGKTNICFNTYFFGENPNVSWKAISTIMEMVSEDSFEATLTAYKRKNYDYISYKLNGEYAYKKEFNKVGYTVPYFCSDDDYNKEEFSITVLKCDESKKADLEKLIKSTEDVIDQINKGSAK